MGKWSHTNCSLVGNLDDLAKHDGGVAVQEGNARQALAVLERVDHERVLRLEGALGDLVRLERVGALELLAASLLADLPGDLAHAASGTAAAHEADRRVANLELARHIQGLDLRGEVLNVLE